MLANRPKGISINKNALNIQANNQTATLQPVHQSNKTPSPPNLKNLSSNRLQTRQQHSNLDQNHVKEAWSALNDLKQLEEPILKEKQHLKQLITAPPPLAKNPISENDELVGGEGDVEFKTEGDKPTLTLVQPKISKIPRRVQTEVSEEIEDIDKSTSRDAIFLVTDLVKDIYDYMYLLESEQSIRPDYLKEQKILTPKVRHRLINWCIDIHNQLNLLQETLYLTIAIIDRYFDQVMVKQQSQVQLVAVSATLIASKYEEIYPPEIGDLLYLTQNAYSRRDVIHVEMEILEQLKFDLGRPIPLAFLRRFSKAAHCDLKMHSIAKFLMEMSLSEYECAHWKPSLLAAAALFTTIHLVHRQDSEPSRNPLGIATNFGLRNRSAFASLQDRWNKTLVHYTRYTRVQLQGPAATLCKILKTVLKNPQSYMSAKKNCQNLSKWPELKSTRVDELIRLGSL